MRIVQIIQRNVQTAGDHVATIDGDRRRTWREFRDRVARLAGGLRELGVGDGDRVAMLALNSDRYMEWYFAVSWAGAVFVPVNIRLAPPEVVHWLTDSGASVLFVDDTFLPMVDKLREQIPAVEHIVHIGDSAPPEGLIGYESLIDESQPIPASERGGDDLAALFYTGGTTGKSKGVRLSHDNLLSNALHLMPVIVLDDGLVCLHAAPMFHIADAAFMFVATLAGATNVFIPVFEPGATVDAIERHRVTVTLLVPAMIKALLQMPDLQSRDFSSLITLGYGAAPMAEDDIAAARQALPGVDLIQGYGQTESAPLLSVLPPERHTFDGLLAGKTRSAGQAIYGVELEILDENDQAAPRGTVGEICARGDNVMLGYHNRPDATEETLRNGWLHTGDVGYMDEDGFVFVVDRAKDMIVTGGENVYSAEVENALSGHPAVHECAVIGVPSEDWGEQVHAVVTTAPEAAVTGEDLIEHCRGRIAGYKCPKGIEFRHDELPKSGAGKILKRGLREPYWATRERAVQ